MSNCIEPSNLQIIPSYEGEILSLDVCIYQAVNIDNVLVWQEQYFDPNKKINVFTVNTTTGGGRPCFPACAAGFNCCDGYCVFYNDYYNCGTCGNRTGLGQICCQGVLVSTNENCGGCGRNCNGKTCCVANGVSSCIDLTSDDRNCGSCGKVCGAGETCCNGTCKNVGWLDDACENCNGPCTGGTKCCGGHCVDLQTDETNCGSCYNNITSDPVLNTCCSGVGVDLYNDAQNCGSCGNDCGDNHVCLNGYCYDLASCDYLYGVCEGYGEICCAPYSPFVPNRAGCIDPQSDYWNCGTCGNACTGDTTCCNGECINYQTDPQNCGECGNDCTDNQTGYGSLCCGGVCKTGVDNNNCGTCGNVCPSGTYCCYGTCIDIMNDNTNCGTCRHPETNPLQSYPSCVDGKQCCGGSCTDLQASLTHCGACYNECFVTIGGFTSNAKKLFSFGTDEFGGYWQILSVECASGSCVQFEGIKVRDPGCLDPQDACNSQSNCCPDPEGGLTPICISKTDPSNCGACGNVCDAGKTCCEKDGAYSCIDTQADNSNCGSCNNQCGTGTNCCDGECVNYSSDESNCGACGVACGVDEICCNGVCKNTKTDRNNCGACGTICLSGMCCDGNCCSSEQASCCPNSDPSLPKVCSILSQDESNCGTCGNVCAIGETCCNGECINLNTDESNCGTCYNSCLAGYTCCDGVCKELSQDVENCGSCNYACGEQDICCNGVCYNYFSDEEHCGSCTNACDEGETCCNGTCVNLNTGSGGSCGACGVTCLYGTICCSGICKDLLSDEANCGTCGNACGAGQTCCNGACVDLETDQNNCGSCGVNVYYGYSCCNGNMVNQLGNNFNCGSCGTTCGEGEACCNGNCVDILDSTANCGGCQLQCPSPIAKCCDGDCKSILFDIFNCGDCGTICVPPQTCYYGTCVDAPPTPPYVPTLPNIPIVPPPSIPACEFCCEITGGLNGQNISALPLTVNLTYDQYFEFQFNTALNITIYESGISSIQNCNVFDSKLFDLSDFLSENTNITPYQFDLSPSCSQGIPYFGLNNFNYNWVCPTQSLMPFIFKVKNNLAEDFSIVIDFNKIDIGPWCCTQTLPVNEQTGLFPDIIKKSVTINFIANVPNIPTFESITSTLDGFTIQIGNYDANFTYSYQSGGNYTVTISNTGLVTVSGMPANTFDTIRISTTRTNYDSKYAEIQGSSLSDPTICRIGGLI